MRVYKVKAFARYAEREGFSDTQLLEIAAEVCSGKFEAGLGKGLIKKRVAAKGRGKSGGARLIIAYRVGSAVFYIYGFYRNEKENIAPRDLRHLQHFAKVLISANDVELSGLVDSGELIEVRIN